MQKLFAQFLLSANRVDYCFVHWDFSFSFSSSSVRCSCLVFLSVFFLDV